MVLNYDRNPNRTTDEKLESLMMNLQLALNEINDRLDRIEKKYDEIQNAVESIGT